MARALTNKQLAVLHLLREGGEWTVKEVASTIRERTPCGACDGTGEGDSRFGCRRCYGHGQVPFHYSDAYVALQRLRERGMVARRCARDQWGDELATHVYFAATSVDPDDPLEQAWRLPSAEGSS